jgi:hypothetical protein
MGTRRAEPSDEDSVGWRQHSDREPGRDDPDDEIGHELHDEGEAEEHARVLAQGGERASQDGAEG